MTGIARRALAIVASTVVFTAGAVSPASASAGPTLWVDIWNSRSAYGTATTVKFILETDLHGYPLVTDENYAAATEVGLTRIDLLVNGQLAGTTTERPWTIDWDPGTLSEVPVRLTARSYDRDGHTHDTVFTSKVDHTPPALQVSPRNGFIRAGAEVSVEATDKSGLNGFDLLSGDRLLETSLGNPAVLHWDPNAADGPATLVVRARDIAGNGAEHRRPVLVDNVPPVVTVAPAAKAYVRGTASFALTALRDASGLGGLEVQFNGTWYAATARAAKIDTRLAADGSRAVRWSVRDQAGNVTDVRRTVIVDNHGPAIAYAQAPKNKALLKKTFTITAKATDKYGVARVQLLVDGHVVATDSRAGYSFKVNPKKYGKKFTVQLRAYDKAGNVKAGSKRTYRR